MITDLLTVVAHHAANLDAGVWPMLAFLSVAAVVVGVWGRRV